MKFTAGKIISAAAIVLVASAAYAAEHEVKQAGKKFSESELRVSVGDTIAFNNDDKRKHNILVKSLGFNSGKQKPGEVVSLEITEAGVHEVRCGIHPKMKLTIIAE